LPPPSPLSTRPYMRPALLAAAMDLLGPGGESIVLEVSGDSMVPTLRHDDAVRVELGRQGCRFGDLLVFVQADSVVVHRCLGPARDRAGARCLRTRGDGRWNLDPPLAPRNVVGRVAAVRRGGEWWSLGGRAARGYAAAVALHDLVWAVAAVAARRLGGERWRAATHRLDRALLRRLDTLWFRRVHARAPLPAPAGGEARR